MHSYFERKTTINWNFKLKKGNPRAPWRFVIWHNRWPILLIRVNFNSHPYIMDASPRPLSDELPPAPLAQKYLGSPTDFLKGVVGKRVIVRLTSGVDYQGPTFFLQFIHGDLTKTKNSRNPLMPWRIYEYRTWANGGVCKWGCNKSLWRYVCTRK